MPLVAYFLLARDAGSIQKTRVSAAGTLKALSFELAALGCGGSKLAAFFFFLQRCGCLITHFSH